MVQLHNNRVAATGHQGCACHRRAVAPKWLSRGRLMAPRRATMSVASGDLGDVTGGHVKIGAAHHYGRNTAWAIAAAVMLLAVIAYTAYSNRQDAAKLSQLEQFR